MAVGMRAYQAQRNATVADDLAAALAHNERARERFELLGRTDQYALFLRLMKAKTPGNRTVQLQRIIESLTEEGVGPGGRPGGSRS